MQYVTDLEELIAYILPLVLLASAALLAIILWLSIIIVAANAIVGD